MSDRYDRSTIFDSFSAQARKALQLAQEEAQRSNDIYIDTQHVLLALVSLDKCEAVHILNKMGISSGDVKAAAKVYIGRGAPLGPVNISLAPHAKHAIKLAIEEAYRVNRHLIGTDHMLLGLLREDEGIAARILFQFGASIENARRQITDTQDVAVPAVGVHRMTDRFDNYTKGAREAIQLAQEEAQRFNHNYIGTEHILLALVQLEGGTIARVFNGLGVDRDKVRSAVEFIIGRGDRMVMSEIGLTPRAKRVIELAVDEAGTLNHHYIGTEHLLLGLIREGEGIAAGVLESLGVSLERTRREVIEVLESSSDSALTKMDSMGEIHVPEGPPWSTSQISVVMLRTLFDYSIWARNQLLPLIEGLDEEELKQGEHKGVYGSIHDTLAHMAQSEWLWMERCKGESPMKLPRGEDFADLAAIVSWWNEVHADAIVYLDMVTDSHLAKEMTYMAPDGKERTRKLWHMLLQVPNHQTEHRAQLGSMLGAMGLDVPATDLVVYLSQLNAGENK